MQHEYFVYDGQEVVRTGRIASKDQQVRGYNGTRNVTATVIEIMPVVKPGEMTWKRWVSEDELYIINDTKADDVLPELPVDEEPVARDPNYDPLDQILDSLRGKTTNGKTGGNKT